ncbi:MAG: hypothetical protein ABIY70_20100 [Capsulimonas sp.]|uniref:hypothetical protein n=1 Tax=Capsulimonas sp. TaxID=2494211 RepID=UPI0032645220
MEQAISETDPSGDKVIKPNATPLSCRFLTDNPYRLLCVPSSESPRALRQKAAACDQARKVGLPIDVGLDAVFGRADLEDCADKVRALTANAATRTIYRQMWPYEIKPLSRAMNSLADLSALKEAQKDAPAFFWLQIDFLENWFQFRIDGNPDALARALHSFALLFEDHEHDAYLSDLLNQEGEDQDETFNFVAEAQNELTRSLLKDTCRTALGALEAFDAGRFQSIVMCLEKSRFDSDFVTRAMSDEFGTYGGRTLEILTTQSQQIARSLASPDYSLKGFWIDNNPYYLLHHLAHALHERLPAAQLWIETIHADADRILEALISRCKPRKDSTAQDLAEMKSALLEIKSLPLDRPAQAWVDQQLEWVANARRPKQPAAAPGQIDATRVSPIKHIPRLFDFKGTGIRFREAQTFPAAPQCRVSTLFVTLFRIPLFPLGRYLVSSDLDGKVIFWGKLPFTWRHRIAVLALITVMAWGYLAIINLTNPRQPVAPQANVSASADSLSYQPAPAQLAEPEPQTEKDTLFEEGKRLQAEVDGELAALKIEKQKLEDAEAALVRQSDRHSAEARKIEADRKKLNRRSQSAIDAFNRNVDESNANLGSYDRSKKRWEKASDAYNVKVDQTNKKLSRLREIIAIVNG